MVYSLRGVEHRVEYNLDRFSPHAEGRDRVWVQNPGRYSRYRRESLYWTNTRLCSTCHRPKVLPRNALRFTLTSVGREMLLTSPVPLKVEQYTKVS